MSYQNIEIPLSSVSFSAGSTSTIDFGALQAQLAGRIAHVNAFKFVVTATPTLSAGSATAEELQKAVRTLTIKDGTNRQYFNGSFASARLVDALEQGCLRAPENDALTTGQTGYFARVFNLAPASMLDPDDFVQPAAIFRGGSITFAFGALTDVDASCTALTLTIQPYAVVQLHDELILGALVDRFESAITNGNAIGCESLIVDLALCNSSLFDAITAGDFANVETIVNGFSRQSIHVADLERMYHDDKCVVSGLTLVHGEPRAATDDNPKVIADTALAASPAVISPIIWAPKRQKLTKLVFHAMPNLVLKWSGSQSSAYMLATRIVPRTAADVGKAEALIKTALNVPIRAMDVRTDSKQPYDGPRRAYMPLKMKVG